MISPGWGWLKQKACDQLGFDSPSSRRLSDNTFATLPEDVTHYRSDVYDKSMRISDNTYFHLITSSFVVYLELSCRIFARIRF